MSVALSSQSTRKDENNNRNDSDNPTQRTPTEATHRNDSSNIISKNINPLWLRLPEAERRIFSVAGRQDPPEFQWQGGASDRFSFSDWEASLAPHRVYWMKYNSKHNNDGYDGGETVGTDSDDRKDNNAFFMVNRSGGVARGTFRDGYHLIGTVQVSIRQTNTANSSRNSHAVATTYQELKPISFFAQSSAAVQPLWDSVLYLWASLLNRTDGYTVAGLALSGRAAPEYGGLGKGDPPADDDTTPVPVSPDALRAWSCCTSSNSVAGTTATLTLDNVGLTGPQALALRGNIGESKNYPAVFTHLKLIWPDASGSRRRRKRNETASEELVVDPMWPAILLKNNASIQHVSLWGEYPVELGRAWMNIDANEGDGDMFHPDSPITTVQTSDDVFWPGLGRLRKLRQLQICFEYASQTLDHFRSTSCNQLEDLSLIVHWGEVGEDHLGQQLVQAVPQIRALSLSPVYSTVTCCPPIEFHSVWSSQLCHLQRLTWDIVMKTPDDWESLTELFRAVEHAPSLEQLTVRGDVVRPEPSTSEGDYLRTSRSLPILWAARKPQSSLQFVETIFRTSSSAVTTTESQLRSDYDNDVCTWSILDQTVLNQVQEQCFRNRCRWRLPVLQQSDIPLVGLLVTLPEVLSVLNNEVESGAIVNLDHLRSLRFWLLRNRLMNESTRAITSEMTSG